MQELTTIQARAYHTWFDTPRGAHAWAVELAAVDEALTLRRDQIAVEVGCGTDRLVAHLAAGGSRVLGLDLHHTLSTIRGLGVRAGVALSPATPLQVVSNVLNLSDLLLVMTVEPGFGGQRYLVEMEPKIAAARAEIDRRGLQVELEVDGGITTVTIGPAARARATIFCAGSALFSGPGTMAERVAALCDAPITNDIALMRGCSPPRQPLSTRGAVHERKSAAKTLPGRKLRTWPVLPSPQ